MQKIQEVITRSREDKKRHAQNAIANEAVPQMVFCKYCGARNKFDATNCLNCGGKLT